MNRFERNLADGLGHIADRATPSTNAWSVIHDRIADRPEHEMEIIMLQKHEPKTRRTGLWMLSAAAAAVLVVVGLVALRGDGDGDPTPVAEDPPAPTVADADEPAVADSPDEPDTEPAEAAVTIAEQFLDARRAYDGDAVRALVADDAAIALTSEWITTPDDYPALVAFEQATGVQFDDVDCTASGDRVRCTYTLSTTLSRAMEVGPYSNSFLFEVADGLISSVNHNRFVTGGGPGVSFYTDVYQIGFSPWLATNHPDDTDVLFDPIDPNNVHPPRLTPEAIALWEERVAEYVADLGTDG